MSVTATQRKTRRDYRMHGNSEFVRVYKQRGYSAIDGPTHAGREGEAVARGGDPAQRRSELSVSPKVGDQLGGIRLVAHARACRGDRAKRKEARERAQPEKQKPCPSSTINLTR